jgi:hypothetical protein
MPRQLRTPWSCMDGAGLPGNPGQTSAEQIYAVDAAVERVRLYLEPRVK